MPATQHAGYTRGPTARLHRHEQAGTPARALRAAGRVILCPPIRVKLPHNARAAHDQSSDNSTHNAPMSSLLAHYVY
jgi:hypothetical protein